RVDRRSGRRSASSPSIARCCRSETADRVAASSAGPQTLERRLGPWDAAAIVVANVIGGGILFSPPSVAALIPNPWLFLGAWLAGGALAFAGAMAYAELSALKPKAGGEYVYLHAAFGRL